LLAELRIRQADALRALIVCPVTLRPHGRPN
jgi:hypothetical protein